MLNNKGFINSTVAFGMILFVVFFLIVLQGSLTNSSLSLKNISDKTYSYIVDKTGIERIYSLLYNNISYVGEMSYEDIGKVYIIEEIDSKYDEIVLENKNIFVIDNKTEIIIDINKEQEDYFEYFLMLNGQEVYSGFNNTIINIPEDYIYDYRTNNTRYGVYHLIINPYDTAININIYFKKLHNRKIRLTDEKNNVKYIEIINENNKQIFFIKEMKNAILL